MRKSIAFFLCSISLTAAFAAPQKQAYSPFSKLAYLTSSFGENRGTRYHAGVDYSTNMEEGWPIVAPENGKVEELRISPYGYGKVYYFKGESGKTWVYAHQSGFNKILDSLVRVEQNALQKNDIKIKPNVEFKKGDTLSFSGSSGIGNPHLHLEIRMGSDIVKAPCENGVMCGDSLAPLVLNAFTWNENGERFTSEEALKNGCLAAPENGAYAAFKIADYSRTPLENPMSVRRVSVFEQKKNGKKGKKLFERKYDELKFSTMIEIRERLLWAEEADTAGDYHFVNTKLKGNIALEVEDFTGHLTTRSLTIKTDCGENFVPVKTKFQDGPVYTMASRSYLKMNCAESKFTLHAKTVLADDLCTIYTSDTPLATIVKKFGNKPSQIEVYNKNDGKLAKTIYLSELNATEFTIFQQDSSRITQKITKPVALAGIDEVLAVVKSENDSVPYFEFHPKGLHFKGNWEVCLDTSFANAPLYYLGETTRRWFIFSKQSNENGLRCAKANELRDIGWIADTTAPALGDAYFATAPIAGVFKEVVRIPVIEKYAGIENGNAINVYANETWIPAEYDSEPHELVIEKELLGKQGSAFSVEIRDEAGNSAKYEVKVP